MIIKNYIVDNYKEFMGYLEQELCKKGISYVRIDNEIHFLDKIIRVYDPEVDRKELINWIFLKAYEEELEILKQLSDTMFKSLTKERFDEYIPSKEAVQYKGLDKPYQVRNKFIQKQESNKVKQMLKRYQR